MKNIVKGLSLALVVVFAFASCAKQPTQLMDEAKAAIQVVVDAKGGIYAKEELNKLNADLQAALDMVTAQSKKFFKKYGPAKEIALNKVVTGADAVKALIPGRIAEAKAAAETAVNEAKAAWEEAKALLEKAPKRKGTKALVERLRAAGLSAAPVLGIDEMGAWPHFRARGLDAMVPSFEGGLGRIYATPWHLAATPGGLDRPSPRLGEHGDYVFGSLLGLSTAQRGAPVAGREVTA